MFFLRKTGIDTSFIPFSATESKMSTFVTAFMTNINSIDFRSLDKYMELGKKLLSQPIPTICFLEAHVYENYFSSHLTSYPYTTFILFENTDNYLFAYEPQLIHFSVQTDNPKKDTPGYMFIQCHKTEWIRIAIEKNPYQTNYFTWIDFGIYHMIQNDMIFALSLDTLSKKKYNSIRIASCHSLSDTCWKDIYRQIVWYFAGSVFGGDQESLLIFAKYMKEKCIEIIETKNHLMWEVNIWYLLYLDHPKLFDTYPCDHNTSILQHF